MGPEAPRKRARGRACPSSAALEEFAVALSSGEPIDGAIEEHRKSCARCDAEVNRFAQEAQALRTALASARTAPASACPSLEELACYIDRALEPATRKNIEQHIAVCRLCQGNLIKVYKQTSSSVSEDAEVYGSSAPVELSGRKRTKRSTEKNKDRKHSAMESTDTEQRKKRLSSDPS